MHDSVLDYFNHYYEPARRHQDGLAAEWDDYERTYYGEPESAKPSGEDAWRSYIFYKYAHQQVKTLVAELGQDDDPTFVYEADRPEQHEYSEQCDALVGAQLVKDGYLMKRLRLIEYAAIYGGAPVKVHWSYRCVSRSRLTATGLVAEKFVVKDQPTLDVVDPRDFMYDPRARTMSEARYCFHRMRLSYSELESQKKSDGSPLYSRLDEIKYSAGTGAGSDTQARILDHDFSGERERAYRDSIEVVEMWTAERLIVRASGNVIIRDEPNPYWHGRLPFEVICLMPSLNDVFGQSLCWLLRDPQENIQSLDNAANDQLKLSIDPPLAVDSDDPDNASRLVEPGARFPAPDAKNAVAPIRVTGAEQYTIDAAIQSQRDLMKNISGITDDLAGQSQADTATQAALNQRQSKGRIGIMLRCLDDSFARVAEMFLMLNQQYLDLSQPQKLLGKKGASAWIYVAPKDIAGMWSVRAKNSSEKAVKELRIQMLMEYLSTAAPMAGQSLPSGKTMDVSPALVELSELFGLEPDEVLVDADSARQQHQKDVVSDGQAQAHVQQMMAPPTDPNAASSPMAETQRKLFESINYKDLPDAAQAAMLESVGLPSDGVSNDNQNATRPNAGKISPFDQALAQHLSPQAPPPVASGGTNKSG